MTQANQTISPLRQRMIDDMTLRKLSPKTQLGYIRAVKNLTRFFGHSPDTATAEDLRRYPVAPGRQRDLQHHAQRDDHGTAVFLRGHAGSPRGDGQDEQCSRAA